MRASPYGSGVRGRRRPPPAEYPVR